MTSRALLLPLLLLAACGQPPAPPPPTPIAASTPAPPSSLETSHPLETAPPTRRYDLSVDERRGGHTLARHVGRTDAQLRERLSRETGISAASTYTDRDTAERVVAAALEASEAQLARWRERTGRRPNLVLDRDEPSPVGRSLRRGQSLAIDCRHAVVVLRWDADDRSSYVLTSYPECRR